MSAKLVQDDYMSDAFAKPTVYLSRKQGKLPIVLDSGAAYSVTPNMEDFMGPIELCSTTVKVIGHDTVEWKIQDLFRTGQLVKTRAFYVPDASMILFSPQAHFLLHPFSITLE
jgi:hypothetical protein